MQGTKTNRSTAIDAVKTVAIFGTLLIHATAAGGFAGAIGSLPWTANLFWSSLLRCAVPLFLMCSGALFLDSGRSLTVGTIWKKYIFRIAVAMFFWAGCYLLWDVVYNGAGFSISRLLTDWLCFRHRNHLYYLVIMVVVYAVLPFTRLFAEKADGALWRYGILLWVVAGSILPMLFYIPPTSMVEGFVREYALPYTWSAIGFGMVGHLIARNRRKLSPLFYGLLFGAGLCITFFVTLAGSARTGELYALFLQGNSPGVVMQAIGIFGFFDSLFSGREPVPVLTVISKASFCVYLSHLFFLDILLRHELSAGFLNPAWAAPLETLALFGGGFVLWLILRRIPVVNRYLI